MKKIMIAMVLAGTQMALATTSQAAVTFEGLKPLVVEKCVPEGERPYADEPEYRELSDTRPVCDPKPKPRMRAAPKPYMVPQK